MKAKLILALFVLFVITSAFKEPPKDVVKLKKTFTSKYAYVPSGLVSIDGAANEIGAFFMFKTEVSNFEYTEFLNDLEDEALREIYSVKSENWKKNLKHAEAYAEHYHTHLAYQNYPVVNVTSESAKAYCSWLTEKYASIDIGLPDDMRIVFRLPTRSEWVRAANGEASSPYSWGSRYLRSTDGIYLANFNAIGSEHIHRNQETGEFEIIPLTSKTGQRGHVDDVADVTAPVDGYAAHGFGIRQMNGNVAEILADSDQAAGGSWRSPGYDIRNESLMTFDEASPEIGFRPIAILTKK